MEEILYILCRICFELCVRQGYWLVVLSFQSVSNARKLSVWYISIGLCNQLGLEWRRKPEKRAYLHTPWHFTPNASKQNTVKYRHAGAIRSSAARVSVAATGTRTTIATSTRRGTKK